MNKSKLNTIANIISGVNYNHHGKKVFGDTIAYLQAKDFNEQVLIRTNIIQISKNSVNNKLLISKNDVLFVAKGTRNYSVIYKGEAGSALAASTFFVIKLKNENVLPEYLSWYLNQKPAQEYIKQQSVGALTPSINKKQFGEMEIPVPALELQKKIVAVDSLRKKEKILINAINTKKDILIEYILNKKIIESNE